MCVIVLFFSVSDQWPKQPTPPLEALLEVPSEAPFGHRPPRAFKSYGSPTPFDLDAERDSFAVLEGRWNIFLALSTIDEVLDVAARPAYKTDQLKSCLFTATLQFPLCFQLPNQSADNWLCSLRDLRYNCDFGQDCCGAPNVIVTEIAKHMAKFVKNAEKEITSRPCVRAIPNNQPLHTQLYASNELQHRMEMNQSRTNSPPTHMARRSPHSRYWTRALNWTLVLNPIRTSPYFQISHCSRVQRHVQLLEAQ